MSTYINMNIIDENGNYVLKDLYDGCNGEWFDNLCGRGYNSAYKTFNTYYGIPNKAPDDIVEAFENNYGYGFRYIPIEDFKNWFWRYRPDLDAMWLTSREKWEYEKRKFIPEEKAYYLEGEEELNAIGKDLFFCEVENEYEPCREIINMLKNNKVEKDDYLVFYFE